MGKKAIGGAVFAVLVFMAWGRAEATTLMRMSIEDMTAAAEFVVVGEVTDVKSSWNAQNTTILTFITIKVNQCIKGTCGDVVAIKQRGGTVDEKTLFIPGMPRFSTGQEALLFLEPDPEGEPGFHYVVGMCQGMFVVEKDAETGLDVAVQQGGAALADVDSDGMIRILGPQAPAKMPLKRLIKRVMKAALSKKPVKQGEVKP